MKIKVFTNRRDSTELFIFFSISIGFHRRRLSDRWIIGDRAADCCGRFRARENYLILNTFFLVFLFAVSGRFHPKIQGQVPLTWFFSSFFFLERSKFKHDSGEFFDFIESNYLLENVAKTVNFESIDSTCFIRLEQNCEPTYFPLIPLNYVNLSSLLGGTATLRVIIESTPSSFIEHVWCVLSDCQPINVDVISCLVYLVVRLPIYSFQLMNLKLTRFECWPCLQLTAWSLKSLNFNQ